MIIFSALVLRFPMMFCLIKYLGRLLIRPCRSTLGLEHFHKYYATLRKKGVLKSIGILEQISLRTLHLLHKLIQPSYGPIGLDQWLGQPLESIHPKLSIQKDMLKDFEDGHFYRIGDFLCILTELTWSNMIWLKKYTSTALPKFLLLHYHFFSF